MMLEMRKGWEQGFDLEMSAGEGTDRAPNSVIVLAARGGDGAVIWLLKFFF